MSFLNLKFAFGEGYHPHFVDAGRPSHPIYAMLTNNEPKQHLRQAKSPRWSSR
jgi:hypothetical protein